MHSRNNKQIYAAETAKQTTKLLITKPPASTVKFKNFEYFAKKNCDFRQKPPPPSWLLRLGRPMACGNACVKHFEKFSDLFETQCWQPCWETATKCSFRTQVMLQTFDGLITGYASRVKGFVNESHTKVQGLCIYHIQCTHAAHWMSYIYILLVLWIGYILCWS